MSEFCIPTLFGKQPRQTYPACCWCIGASMILPQQSPLQFDSVLLTAASCPKRCPTIAMDGKMRVRVRNTFITFEEGGKDVNMD